MGRSTSRSACVQAGILAGLGGLVTFLVLHHLWIVPIWFVAPIGAVMAAAAGAVVGAAYAELLSRLPRRPWRVAVVALGSIVILGPSVVVAQLLGPVYEMGAGGRGRLLVPGPEAVAGVVAGLLATTTVTGAALGWLVGRSRAAVAWVALSGFALAVGPGHNIPLLGATPAVATELVILAAVIAVASAVLVETEARRT